MHPSQQRSGSRAARPIVLACALACICGPGSDAARAATIDITVTGVIDQVADPNVLMPGVAPNDPFTLKLSIPQTPPSDLDPGDLGHGLFGFAPAGSLDLDLPLIARVGDVGSAETFVGPPRVVLSGGDLGFEAPPNFDFKLDLDLFDPGGLLDTFLFVLPDTLSNFLSGILEITAPSDAGFLVTGEVQDVQTAVVPEPFTGGLLGVGLAGIALQRRRSRGRRTP